MSQGLRALHDRRALLVQRAAQERDELAATFEPWTRPLAMMDRGFAFLSSLSKSAPLLGPSLGLGFAALAVARPRSIAGWVHGALSAWRSLKTVGSVWLSAGRRVRRRG